MRAGRSLPNQLPAQSLRLRSIPPARRHDALPIKQRRPTTCQAQLPARLPGPAAAPRAAQTTGRAYRDMSSVLSLAKSVAAKVTSMAMGTMSAI